MNQFLSAVKFLYGVTLERHSTPDACCVPAFPKTPIILSQQEVARFFDYVPSIRYRAALMVAYGAGLRVSEVVALKVEDIDSQRMLLRVQKGKGRRDRYAILSPRLLQVLRAWYRAARPTDWLFPSWRVNAHLTPASLQDALSPTRRAPVAARQLNLDLCFQLLAPKDPRLSKLAPVICKRKDRATRRPPTYIYDHSKRTAPNQ